MANVYASFDGGATFESLVGDAWPATAGRHIVRMEFRDAPYARRVMVRIESTDDDNWGIKSIVVKGKIAPQEASMGTAVAPIEKVVPRRFSQETEPTLHAGELAIWYIPSTGATWLIYNDNDAGQVRVEID